MQALTTTPECGASFSGGNTCVVAGLPFCYDTGSFGYEELPAQTMTISFSGDVVKLDVFFGGGGTDGDLAKPWSRIRSRAGALSLSILGGAMTVQRHAVQVRART